MHALETGVIEGGPTLELPRRELRPRPYRSFQGRIFSASVSPESSAMVAELGLGMMFIIVKPAEMLAHDVARHQATWQKVRAEGGGTPPQSLVSVVVAVDEDRAYAEDLASRYYNAAHANAVQHYGMDKSTFGKIRGYEFYRNLRVPAGATAGPPVTVIHGNPDDVLEKLAEFKHAANAQGFLTIFHGIPGPDGERNLKCFVKHCLPELKKWPSDPTF
jgi:alkanesulfonate monooxygenase SsuD/methylene tetrahydromethanopterin reductase-like flavin-dependent oxidoreductase (luciferase family)